MDYISRNMENSVLKASGQYPVVMLCGQRQTGKSTMLKTISEPDRVYVSFDRLKTGRLAENDPALFFETYGHKLLIDEFRLCSKQYLRGKKDGNIQPVVCCQLFQNSGS